MAKTIDHLDLYVSIAPYKHETASDQTFDSLRVYVSYRKGSGFIVGYHPGWGDGSFWGCVFCGGKNPLTSGAWVLAKAATKNSVKELQQMYDNLNAGTARKIIAFLFDQRKWEVLKESMRHIALNSAWATEELLQSLTKPYTPNAQTPDTPNAQEESHMMRQFRYLKSKHPDALLLFRCGDFYESYEEDAKECAKVLGITLTKRSSDGTAMAGFPHHALDTYLPKLIRAVKRVAICDQLEDPKLTKRLVKRGITELVSPATNNSNNIQNNSTTMETKTMTAQDYVGKRVNVNGSNNFYTVKSADGDKLTAEFHMGDRVMPCPIPISQLQTMVTAGKWTICDDAPVTAEPIANANDNQPISEESKPVAEKPTAQTVTMKPTTTEPKPKRQTRPAKNVEKPEAKDLKPETKTKPSGKLRYETYKNKKGKTCAKIVGFTEGDAMLERGNAERIHASSTYERDKKGVKLYMLIFGPRYADAAKDVCRAMNEGKTLVDCQAIIDAATEERVQKREEWKAKRAAYLANRAADDKDLKPETKQGYSSEDVADMLKKIMAGGAIPEEIKRAMAA